MKRDIKVVIGASYGDEGKGLMTDYFCGEAEKADMPCITVLHNGGSQRGHTVISPDGLRHVFHHLSSGTFAGSDTYFADSFIINPMIFVQEYTELDPDIKIYCSPKCMWSTPFDMMLNQIIEDSRGEKRHGSCGYGIWETIVRYNNSETVSFPNFMLMSITDKIKYLENIRDNYMAKRLKDVGVNIPPEWKDIVYNDGIIEHFIEDCNFFASTIIYAEEYVLENYPYIVFEGGQGLLLSQDKENPHTTPSFTGAENPVRIIGTLNGGNNVEVCYVTRTYLTRHGAGEFPQECAKYEINPDMVDRTNVPNDYQGTLRYGKIDIGELKQRIYADFSKFSNAKISLAVTHMDETHGKLITPEGEINPDPGFIGINRIGYSYSEKKLFGI